MENFVPPKLDRREFLGLLGAGAALSMLRPRAASASAYSVGVGRGSAPYDTTLRAIEASGQWPGSALAGRTVVIKPNLVARAPSDSGITTDPDVVRAIVDLALGDGAEQVLIVEGGAFGAAFSDCGYDFFHNYDPLGRVRLIDLNTGPEEMLPVPQGLAYAYLFLPEAVTGTDIFFISVAKMKTHTHTLASLSMKNLFGLPKASRYSTSYSANRFGMHERGVHQSVLDLNSVRPIDFAVVDAVWAMEGNGPFYGTSVRMDTVLAGKNALAVDRVCLEAMGIPQSAVQHLTLAADRDMGSKDLSEIQLLGDPLSPRPFVLPEIPSAISQPWVFPRSFAPRSGQTARFLYWLGSPGGLVYIRVVRGFPESSALTPLRVVQNWTQTAPGIHFGGWDGRDDNGEWVQEPGFYAVQIISRRDGWKTTKDYSVGWVQVQL